MSCTHLRLRPGRRRCTGGAASTTGLLLLPLKELVILQQLGRVLDVQLHLRVGHGLEHLLHAVEIRMRHVLAVNRQDLGGGGWEGEVEMIS